jgi:hypothetical protein
VYIEQRLAICEVCCEVLALQYAWAAGRPPTHSQDRVVVRCFACPLCGHKNAFVTLMYACAFQLKVVPGPKPDQRVHPNSVRRLLSRVRESRRVETVPPYRGPDWEGRLNAALLCELLARRLEQLWPVVAWYFYRALAN